MTLSKLLAVSLLVAAVGCAGQGRLTAVSDTPPTWVDLPVVSADFLDSQHGVTLAVETRTPGPGWQVELRSVATEEESTAEFELVGAGSTGVSEETTTAIATARIPSAPSTKLVVVRGSDGQLVLQVPH